jgi:hypothetical protein
MAAVTHQAPGILMHEFMTTNASEPHKSRRVPYYDTKIADVFRDDRSSADQCVLTDSLGRKND